MILKLFIFLSSIQCISYYLDPKTKANSHASKKEGCTSINEVQSKIISGVN